MTRGVISGADDTGGDFLDIGDAGREGTPNEVAVVVGVGGPERADGTVARNGDMLPVVDPVRWRLRGRIGSNSC